MEMEYRYNSTESRLKFWGVCKPIPTTSRRRSKPHVSKRSERKLHSLYTCEFVVSYIRFIGFIR